MQCLVDKIPVEAALVFRVSADEIPVFFQVAARVSHCVIVLTLDEGTGMTVVLCIFLTGFRRIVHRTEDVRSISLQLRPFVLDGAALVLRLDPVVGFIEVLAVPCLVAETPDDNTGMVEFRAYIVLVALHDLSGKEGSA